MTADPTADPVAQANDPRPLLWALFGHQEGYLVAGYALLGRWDAGRYQHIGGFSERFYQWPAEGDRFLADAAEQDRLGADVYFCPMLRTTPSAARRTPSSRCR